jgi:hypothetical protein
MFEQIHLQGMNSDWDLTYIIDGILHFLSVFSEEHPNIHSDRHDHSGTCIPNSVSI